MQLGHFLAVCLPLAALANVGTEGSVSDLGASGKPWGKFFGSGSVMINPSKPRLGSAMDDQRQASVAPVAQLTDVAGKGIVEGKVSPAELRAAKKAAALEKESSKLLKKDLELRQEMQEAKNDEVEAEAEAKSAKATKESLAEETQAEKDKVMKEEEKAAESGRKLDVEDEVGSLQKYEEEEKEGMAAISDAAISEKNSATKMKIAQRKAMKAEVREKSVKGQLKTSLKDAKRAMEVSASSGEKTAMQ